MAGLKAIFNTIKKETSLSKVIDVYLTKKPRSDDDRAQNVNAPSQAGGCPRASYYSRIKAEKDSNLSDPRSIRIFNNGDHVHSRLQQYLLEEGTLLMDEVPLRHEEYNIQGHTDGLGKIKGSEELFVLELKSINDKGFTSLKGAKPEHISQGFTYLFCLEERRKFLRNKYKTVEAFEKDKKALVSYYKSLYPHTKDGRKHTKEEKLAFKVKCHLKADLLLLNSSTPIKKVIFLYENKNDQELKEYAVNMDSEVMDNLLSGFKYINDCVYEKIVPKRPEGCTKSGFACKYCDYKIECYC